MAHLRWQRQAAVEGAQVMQVFLETERLVLRRFTIETEILPAFLDYYQRYEGFGFWAAVEKATGEFLGCGLAAGDGEGGPEAGADLPSGLAASHRG